jgi:hypothetical protein
MYWGISEDFVETIRVQATLHDVRKIYTNPDSENLENLCPRS